MKNSSFPRLWMLTLVWVLTGLNVSAQVTADSLKRKIALLDLTLRNAETSDGEIFSAKYILKTAGIPFYQTSNVDSAKRYGMILASSRLDLTTFSTAEKDSLISFVSNGGILVAPNVKDPYFDALFGINGNTNVNFHNRIFFRTFLNDPSFKWLDDSLEQTISLADTSYPTTINTREYSLAGALALAQYEDLAIAITKNFYGSGRAYALGFSFKNLILNNQLNRDMDANRIYSNGFEPTSDAVMLFVKGIYLDVTRRSVWLHTSPFNSKTTLMITHDVDATSAYDTMHYYADYEQSVGLRSSYFFTTHYVNDGLLSDFYNLTNIPKVQYVLNQGHVAGSHSVGHFPDFDDETVFPLGVLGNSSATYVPYNSGSGATSNGTVLGEVEVSKSLLNNNFGLNIKTFRAGYLAFNDKLINALDTLGYLNNTTISAGDVLTNFPYQQKKDRSASAALSNVWEFPMTISDVFNSNPITSSNYPQKVNTWLNVIGKNMANNAPNVLLIHPTRMYKLNAQQDLINALPAGVFVTNLEYFADYWRIRNNLTFESFVKNDTLTIVVPSSMLPLDSAISFVADSGQFLAHIRAQDDFGNALAVVQSNFNQHDVIIHFATFPTLHNDWLSLSDNGQVLMNCFPNPATDRCNVEFRLKNAAVGSIQLLDLYGKVWSNAELGLCSDGWHKFTFSTRQMASGIYLVKLTLGKETSIRKVVINP